MDEQAFQSNWPLYAITKECYTGIRKYVPEGTTMLEFGSGFGSQFLAPFYDLHSFESEKKWMNMYHDQYHYVPMDDCKVGDGWYNRQVALPLLHSIPYKALLIDGPDHARFRPGTAHYSGHLHDDLEWIIMDDIVHPQVRPILEHLVRRYNINQYTVGGVYRRDKHWTILSCKDPHFTFEVTSRDVGELFGANS